MLKLSFFRSHYDKLIVILRDPIEQRISYLNFLNNKGSFHQHESIDYFEEHLEKDLSFSIPYWKDWHQNILNQYKSDQMCIIFYEELKENLILPLVFHCPVVARPD